MNRVFSYAFILTILLNCLPGRESLTKPQALKIHHRLLTIDTHTDTPFRLANENWDIGRRHDSAQPAHGALDFPRMRDGGLDAVFFAAYVRQRDRTADNYRQAMETADHTIQSIHQAALQYRNLVAVGISPEDAERNAKKGLLTIYIGMENGFALGQDVENVQRYYDMGVRYITLCHIRNNDLCDSSTDSKGPEHHGLSDFGKSVIARMNQLGMIIDVSHISDEAFYDVLQYSRAPVIASHSCARAVCDNPRNLDDAMLRALAAKGGVMQLCLLSDYVKKLPANPQRQNAVKKIVQKYGHWDEIKDADTWRRYEQEWFLLEQQYPPELATVQDAVDHIDHVVKCIGIDHVGIGTDFDGGGGLQDCRDVTGLPNITMELLKRGYSEKDLQKIWSGNFMRVFRAVEEVSREIR